MFRADDFVPKFFFQFRAEKISARNWNQITKLQFRAEKKKSETGRKQKKCYEIINVIMYIHYVYRYIIIPLNKNGKKI
jgi:hypothetical protein